MAACWMVAWKIIQVFSSLSKDIVKTNLNYLDGKLDGCLLDGCLEDQPGFFLTKQRHCENQLKLSRREAGWLLAGWLLGRSTRFFSSLSKDIVKTNLNYLDGKLDGCLLDGCLEDQPGFFSSLSKDIKKTNLNYLDGKLDGCLLDGCLEDQPGFFLTKQRHCENQLKLSRREAGWLLAGWLLGRSTRFFPH